MMNKRVQMMDAGMRLFRTEKPFGTVLGGIKTEMAKYGTVFRERDLEGQELPEACADCDLFLDRSTKYKTKYISCKLEDAGTVGTTDEGEEIHRYAASLKEGNMNTATGIYVHLGLVIIWAMLGWFISGGSGWITLAFTIIGFIGAWKMLRPSKDNARTVASLLESFENAK
ncbi:MAG: hypothetical protein J6L98_04495 [Bacteroidales bacterium]|nr:hypothetical protein [Bacteroidales bacterium]MBP3269922.1 hypothetical protein [Bacteroidales bacterium]